jgi:hypothetical protein
MASGEVIEGHETARIGEGGGKTRADEGERERERERGGEKTQFFHNERKDVAKRKRARVEERRWRREQFSGGS